MQRVDSLKRRDAECRWGDGRGTCHTAVGTTRRPISALLSNLNPVHRTRTNESKCFSRSRSIGRGTLTHVE